MCIMQKIWTDEQGAVFSADKLTLQQCPNVEVYVIPDHVEKVSPDAFNTAPNLRSIDFNHVYEIPNNKIVSLEEVPIFDGQSWQGEFEDVEITRYCSIFEACPHLEEIKISENNMISVAPYAFAGLKHLKAFCVPRFKDSATHMDIRALLASHIEQLTLVDDFEYSKHWGDSIYGNPTHYVDWLSREFFPKLKTLHILFSDSCQHVLATLKLFELYHLNKVIMPKDILAEIESKLPRKEGLEYVGE